MRKISQQIESRLVTGIQKFQPILRKASLSNKNESDTVTIIVDILCEVFGYDKYESITSELAIKRTFCDFAVKLDGQVKLLLSAKLSRLISWRSTSSRLPPTPQMLGLTGWSLPTVSTGEYTVWSSRNRWTAFGSMNLIFAIST